MNPDYRLNELNCTNPSLWQYGSCPRGATAANANDQNIAWVWMYQRPYSAKQLVNGQEGNPPLRESLNKKWPF
jgi:hypothetical protein